MSNIHSRAEQIKTRALSPSINVEFGWHFTRGSRYNQDIETPFFMANLIG